MLEVSDLAVAYGSAFVLRGVNLSVGPSECVGLFGPNGAGKTTLAHTISGGIKPKMGELNFEGVPLTRLSAAQRVDAGIVHVPQGRRLFQRMTVLENLELGSYRPAARIYGRRRLQMVLDVFPDLESRLGAQAGALSGGQQQMVAIGRGLMSCPSLLILDEPLMGLAPSSAKTVKSALGIIMAESGMSMLLIEQRALEIIDLCQRGYVLVSGVVTKNASAIDLKASVLEELYFDDPNDNFTIDYCQPKNGLIP